MADFDLNQLTIKCFSKRRYTLPKLNKSLASDSESIKFYRKRIVSVTRDLARGKEASEELKTAYNTYAMRLVSYFRAQDKSLIIQETYKGMKVEKKNSEASLECKDANVCMMRKPNDTNMRGYVVRHDTRATLPTPEIKLINLKSSIFKKKRR